MHVDRAADHTQIKVECEECGAVTLFPAKLNGTLQECDRCGAYVDVGDIAWPGEEDTDPPDQC